MTLSTVAVETSPGVFHAKEWGASIPDNLFELLIDQAKGNGNRKSRLCLHPSPSDPVQITYLAFFAPYADRIHSHPTRPEIIVPVFGKAQYSEFDGAGNVVSSEELDGQFPIALSTPLTTWHGIKLISESFIMIEIGSGPFTKSSTVYL